MDVIDALIYIVLGMLLMAWANKNTTDLLEARIEKLESELAASHNEAKKGDGR
jgi:BMFP domain-containing protein YqiC